MYTNVRAKQLRDSVPNEILSGMRSYIFNFHCADVLKVAYDLVLDEDVNEYDDTILRDRRYLTGCPQAMNFPTNATVGVELQQMWHIANHRTKWVEYATVYSNVISWRIAVGYVSMRPQWWDWIDFFQDLEKHEEWLYENMNPPKTWWEKCLRWMGNMSTMI